MNLLFSNDKRGEYPASWYAATAQDLPRFPMLKGETRADVCVIGGGFTGLSAALHLAQAGRDVVLVDAHRVGFGASGRNGGQLGSGQRVEQTELERMLGPDDAAKLWSLAQDAKALVKSLVAEHAIDCDLKPGVAHACFTRGEVAHEHAYAEHLQTRYGYDQITPLDRDGMQAVCPSPKYVGGTLDMGAGHLHPLNYAIGLARAAAAAGARIHEGTHVHTITEGRSPIEVRTDAGKVRAEHVILAANGYLGGLNRKVAARVMPINNFIAATPPLGDDAARVLARDVAVADTKFVVNYFRLTPDKRLLFGGGESYGYRFPDIGRTVRKPMAEIFPHLADIPFDYTWGGTLAITMRRLPYVARVAPNILSASGYSGHGVGSATHAGQVMARAIQGETDGFDTLSRIPSRPFPGGPAMRTPLLTLAMTWYALRDRLGI
ncbi:NAD(P)/FAD-dependent oxidoreductase [Marimonas lutisalis]|uniref:NAD(P)/FAD-dependent oxidoreductase n=1 Tax=Marimonas lutisalis TaxID=2545756 RepID=UPI0010F91AB9|nr:FAD-binding oxidoreductase [Marimonas lutisalis]